MEDKIDPTASAQDLTVQLDSNGLGSITVAQVDNGSADACGIADLTLSQTDFDCSHLGADAVTLTVTDENGNQHSHRHHYRGGQHRSFGFCEWSDGVPR